MPHPGNLKPKEPKERKRTDYSSTPPLAMSIGEFCLTHRISRSGLYGLWRAGIGPKVIAIGSKKLISVEAAEAWRREREMATQDAA